MASGVNFNNFAAIGDELHEALSAVVRKTALDLQATAQGLTPVDTGFLKNSIYTSTFEGSTYGEGGYTGKGEAVLLDPVDPPSNEFTAYVGVGANYGIYVEMGTRFTPAQPYFHPAVDMTQQEFTLAVEAVMDTLGDA